MRMKHMIIAWLIFMAISLSFLVFINIHQHNQSVIQCKQLGYEDFTKEDGKLYCVGGEFALQMVMDCPDTWGLKCKLYEVRESKIIGI